MIDQKRTGRQLMSRLSPSSFLFLKYITIIDNIKCVKNKTDENGLERRRNDGQ
jgi:hypothetical protein